MSIFLELAALLAIFFLIITLVGAGILLVGIILDVIWGVKKKKNQKVNTVHKVFAILLTVVGFLVAIGPFALLGITRIAGTYYQSYRVSDLSEDEIVYSDSYGNSFREGFTLNGKHYVPLFGLHIPLSVSMRDEYLTDKVGAAVNNEGLSRFIYKVDSLVDKDILYIDNGSDLIYAEEAAAEEIFEYYRNEAPLYCLARYENNSHRVTINDIDYDHARQIRDMLLENGVSTAPENTLISDQRGYIEFISTDNLSNFSLYYRLGPAGLMIEYDGNHLMVEGDDYDYIMELINAE